MIHIAHDTFACCAVMDRSVILRPPPALLLPSSCLPPALCLPSAYPPPALRLPSSCPPPHLPPYLPPTFFPPPSPTHLKTGFLHGPSIIFHADGEQRAFGARWLEVLAVRRLAEMCVPDLMRGTERRKQGGKKGRKEQFVDHISFHHSIEPLNGSQTKQLHRKRPPCTMAAATTRQCMNQPTDSPTKTSS